jgi:hypothetical protein
LTLRDVTIDQMAKWITAHQALHHSNTHTIASFNKSYHKAECVYCGKRGHVFKNKRIKQNLKECPQARERKPPCDKYQKWHLETHGRAWNQPVMTSPSPSAASNTVLTMQSTNTNAKIALTADIKFKGKYSWLQNITTITDLGGCDNLIDQEFVKHELSLRPRQLTQSEIRTFTGINNSFFANKVVDVECDFNGHKKTLTFYLVPNLPRKVLIGFPFFNALGAIFDLRKKSIDIPDLSTSIRLIATNPSDNDFSSTFCYFTPHVQNADDIVSSFANTSLSTNKLIEKSQPALINLLNKFEDIFEPATQPSNIPEINVPLKPEYQHIVFNRRDRPRSAKEKQIIDDNARELIKQNKAKLNPQTPHNLTQVIVQRFDKQGKPIPGRERVCLNMRPVNVAFEHFHFPLPHISDIKDTLASSTFFLS